MTGTQIMVTLIFCTLFVCMTIESYVKAKYGDKKKDNPK